MNAPFKVSIVSVPHGLRESELAVTVVFVPVFSNATSDAKLSDPMYRPLREWPMVVQDDTFKIRLVFLRGAASPKSAVVKLQRSVVPKIWHHFTKLPLPIGAKESIERRRAGGADILRAIKTDDHDLAVKLYMTGEIAASKFNPNFVRDTNASRLGALESRKETRSELLAVAKTYREDLRRQKRSAYERRTQLLDSDPSESGPITDVSFCKVQERLFQYPGIRERCGFQISGTVEIPEGIGMWDAVYAEPVFPTAYGPIEVVRPTIPTRISKTGWAADSARITGGLLNFGLLPGTLGDTVPGVDISASAADIYATGQESVSFSAKGGALYLSVPGIIEFLDTVRAAQTQALGSQGITGAPSYAQDVAFDSESLTRGFAADLVDLGEVSFDRNTSKGKALAKAVAGATRGWQTLCRRWVSVRTARAGIFGFEEHEIVGFDELAVLAIGATSSTNAGEINVHDVLLRYANASPVVQQQKEKVTGADRTLDVVVRASVPRDVKLPELQFGHRYAVRLRAVDITGETMLRDSESSSIVVYSKDDGPVATAFNSNYVDFGRISPVQAPALAVPHSERRSQHIDRVAVLLAEPNAFADTRHAWRKIEAPPVSSIVAEMHGMFSNLDYEHEQALRRYLEDRPGGVPVPYPDPLAKGATVFFKGPDGSERSLSATYPGTWPELEPLHVWLEIVHGLPRALPWSVRPACGGFIVSVLPGIEVKTEIISIMHSSAHHHLRLLHPNVLDKAKTGGAREATFRALSDSAESVVTRPRTLSLVAATKVPAWQPVLIGAPNVALRAADSVTASITVAMDVPLFSSDRLEISAVWPEWRISPKDGYPERYDRSRPITTIGLSGTRETVSFCFDDTYDKRRRDVRYRFKVRSRYAGLFAHEDPKNFTVAVPPGEDEASLDLGLVTLPNTAVPPKLAIDRIATTFEWSTLNGSRTRAPGTVRLYFVGDMHATGDGEQVGIVLQSDAPSDDASLIPVSWIGRDPLFPESGTSIQKSALENTSLQGSSTEGKSVDVSYAYENAAGKPKTAKLSVLPYDPRYDDREQLWYVDLGVSDASLDTQSYMPFVGLAVCRYQPASVDDRHLSTILELPTFQPLPKRTTTITVNKSDKGGWAIKVSLSGTQFAQAHERKLGVVLQRKRFTVVDRHAGSDLIWERDDRTFTVVDSTPGNETYTLWLDLPYPRGFRVSVSESELYSSNDVRPGTARPRLVYIDVSEDLDTYVKSWKW